MTSKPNQHVQNVGDAESFLASVRGIDEPSRADKDRTRAALAAAIAAGVTIGTTSKAAAAAQTAAGAANILGAAKIVVPLVLLLGGAGFYFAINRAGQATDVGDHGAAPGPTTSNVVVVEPTPVALPARPAPTPVDAPVSAPAHSRSPASTRAATTTSSNVVSTPVAMPEPQRVGDLNAEMLLLRQAQVALRDGRAADALQILDTHESHFADGVLAPERAVLRARAEQRLAAPSQAESDTSPTPPEH